VLRRSMAHITGSIAGLAYWIVRVIRVRASAVSLRRGVKQFPNALCAPLITFCPVLVRGAFWGDVGDFGVTLAGFGVGGRHGAIRIAIAGR